MGREINLNGEVAEPVIVNLFGKQYRLRPITRSVQKGLEEATVKLAALQKDDTAGGDEVVDAMASSLDALLAIEGGHRTPAKKLLMEKWENDELSVTQIEHYFDALQEAATESRPT